MRDLFRGLREAETRVGLQHVGSGKERARKLWRWAVDVWDDHAVYKTGWSAVTERDLAHDKGVWCIQDPEYGLGRNRTLRKFPAASLWLVLNMISSPENTRHREAWSLGRYWWPVQTRPKRRRGLRLGAPRRRPKPWYRKQRLSLEQGMQFNYDVLMKMRQQSPARAAVVDASWAEKRYAAVMREELARERAEGRTPEAHTCSPRYPHLGALFLAEMRMKAPKDLYADLPIEQQRENWLRTLRFAQKIVGPDRRRRAIAKVSYILRTQFLLKGGTCTLEVRPLGGKSQRWIAREVVASLR